MKITVHQPHLLPWAGFWGKVAASDLTVLMLDTQYVKGEYLNRVQLNDSWLTLEVLNPKESMSRIEVSSRSIKKCIKTLEMEIFTRKNKSRNPDLATLEAQVVATMMNASHGNTTLLEPMNVRLIHILAEWLGLSNDHNIIEVPYITHGETSSQRIMNYLRQFLFEDKNTYLSGSGGLYYLNPEDFPKNVEVQIQQWHMPQNPNSVVQLIAQDAKAVHRIIIEQFWLPFRRDNE
jgi:hypothetical protein